MKKKDLIKPGLSYFGDSYPKRYLENLRGFFRVLEAKGLVEKQSAPHRTLRFKTE